MPRAFSFRINLRDVAPRGDPVWQHADAKTRKEVLGWLVILGLKEKDRELAAGLDRKGVPLAPIAPATRKYRKSEMGPADPNAPALMPAYAVSRTRLLLQGRPTRDGAEFSWETDPITGKNWGKILDAHRRGRGRWGRIPRRDVIGISPRSVERVRQAIASHWQVWKTYGGQIPKVLEPQVPPPRYAVTGRTDYQAFDFAASSRAEAQAALERGYATGFRQRVPGTGGAAFGGPPAPTPPTKPRIPGLAEAMRQVEEERAYTEGFKIVAKAVKAKPAKLQAPPKPAPLPKPKPKPIPPIPKPKPEPVPVKPAIQPKPVPRFGIPRNVTYFTPGAPEQLAKATKHLFPKGISRPRLAALAGALDDSRVQISSPDGKTIDVIWSHPDIDGRVSRVIRQDVKDRTLIENVMLYVKEDRQGKGVGSAVLNRQVEEAIRNKVDRLRTYAAKGQDENGYSVWPRLGYDAPIPFDKLPPLPEPLRDAKLLSDLMNSAEGRSWWETNGIAMDMTFDLRPGSLSRLLWEARQRRR